MTRIVRLGLIGAGSWGRLNIRALEEIRHVRLARLASTNPDSCGLVSEDCVVTSDWRSVATAEDVDGVIITSPARLHAEMADLALGAGKAVRVEKPLAQTVADADVLVALARTRGGILHVDHIDLFNPAWKALKQRLPALGEIVAVDAVFGAADPGPHDSPPRWEWGPHPLALCLDLLGSPQAMRSRRPVALEAPTGLVERVEIELQFDHAVVARVVTGNAFAERRRRVTVRARQATLVYDDNAVDKLVQRCGDHVHPISVGPGGPLGLGLAEFADAIRAGKPDWEGAALGAAVVGVLAGVDADLRLAGPSPPVMGTGAERRPGTGDEAVPRTASSPTVPLVDLGAQHQQVAETVAAGWKRVLGRSDFVLGREVEEFERAYAAFSGVRHCVGVGSGTDALELALRALGVGQGDEVILPANTFVATALAVIRSGALPVLADVHPDSHLLDVESVLRAVTPRTRVILPVHLYGQMALVERLRPVADRVGAVMLEDAAQAHGARRWGHGPAHLGAAAGTSFYPVKNLGAYGEAGAVLTNSDILAGSLRRMRNYGSDVKHLHPQLGFNSRLDTLQAVVLGAKLELLAGWNSLRARAAARYDEWLRDLEQVIRPSVVPGNDHVWHLYVVRVPERDEVLGRLQEAGIGAGVHYQVPIHLQGAFRRLGYHHGDFPVTEAAAAEVLSLPIYPEITPEQQQQVVGELEKALPSA